ncbi:MAG: ABC transporter substrate-binding protein, partial [Aliifodinibius sp.]|nr:ABC transporter substrate-binding protein [Fodinibius sp.]
FHDGQPLTAHDVAYTYESILDPALNAPIRNTLEVIDKINVLDSFQVKFKLKRIHAPFLSDIQVGIVPAHIAESETIDLKQQPVGSGPFKFVEWKADSYIELERNDNYWKESPR